MKDILKPVAEILEINIFGPNALQSLEGMTLKKKTILRFKIKKI